MMEPPRDQITPIERAFLLQAARAALRIPGKTNPDAISHGAALNWHRLTFVASQHAMPQLLAVACQSRSDLPPAVAAAISRAAARLAIATFEQVHELTHTVQLLEHAGVRVLAIKGPTLAALAYPNPALRPSVDLDIMVSPAEAPRALCVLQSAGYRPDSPSIDWDPGLNLEYERTLLSPNGKTTLELHWALLPMGHAVPCTFDELWSRAQAVRLPTGQVHTLGLVDLLLYLCQHGTKHGWERLMWICDIAMLAPTFSDSAWNSLLARCRETGTLRMVLLGLTLARNLLGISLASPVRRAIRADSRLKSLSTSVERRLFDTRTRTEGLATHTRDFLFNLAVRERLRDRVRLCLWAVKPTVRDRERIRLPRAMDRLHFVLRPFRVFARHAIRPA